MSEYSLFLLMAGMSALQYWIGTRHIALLGIILPVGFFTIMTWMYISSIINNLTSYIILLVIGLFFLVEEWLRGRKSLKKRKYNELNKMKTQDLK
ncbi:hypothetical protein [Bacillus sp. FSL R12-0069]|uniref:hypothetical protein n=1 Tax=Bacillus sp. FSL R12-0069 TaxID=2975342 RepID=UPI0030F5C4E1